MSMKRWLPLLCAVVMVLSSSMTVFASDDYTKPGDYVGGNFVLLQSGLYFYFVETNGNIYVDVADDLRLSNINDDTYLTIWRGKDCVNWQKSSSVLSNTIITDDFTILRSNVNIYKIDTTTGEYVEDDDHLFFQGPLPIAAQAVKAADLPKVVANQAKIIVMIAICCLALVIGSTVLVPRLRRYLG